MNLAEFKEELKILSDFFKTSEENITIVKQLLGGMSNKVYLVTYQGNSFTLRMPGKKANLFVDRQSELCAIREAENLSITNKTIYFSEPTGVKIAEYINGQVLTEVNIDDYLTGISDLLKKMHNHKTASIKRYDLLAKLRLFESYNIEQNETYYKLKDAWISMYESKYKHDQLVFCHGDAQRSNIVVDNNRLYLFDFEYSGLNSPYYDIASFGNISFLDSINLLKVYIGKEPNKDELNKLRFYRMFQVLKWHQVAKKKHEIGLGKDLHLDFNMIASKYLSVAGELYNDILRSSNET